MLMPTKQRKQQQKIINIILHVVVVAVAVAVVVIIIEWRDKNEHDEYLHEYVFYPTNMQLLRIISAP